MNTKRLKELAALSGIISGLSGPGIQQQEVADRANAQRMQSALGILGLVGQQQHQTEQEKNDAQRLAVEQARVDAEKAHYGALEGNAKQNNLAAILPYFGQMDPAAKAAAGAMFPELGSAMETQHQADVQKKVAATQPAIGAVYQKNANDPVALAKTLGLMEPTVDPEVWKNLDWTSLNSGLPAPPAPQSQIPPLTMPPGAVLGGKANAGPRQPAGGFGSDIWSLLFGPSATPTPTTGGGKASAGPKRPLNQ